MEWIPICVTRVAQYVFLACPTSPGMYRNGAGGNVRRISSEWKWHIEIISETDSPRPPLHILQWKSSEGILQSRHIVQYLQNGLPIVHNHKYQQQECHLFLILEELHFPQQLVHHFSRFVVFIFLIVVIVVIVVFWKLQLLLSQHTWRLMTAAPLLICSWIL